MNVKREMVAAHITVLILLAPILALVVRDGFSLPMGKHALVCLLLS